MKEKKNDLGKSVYPRAVSQKANLFVVRIRERIFKGHEK